MWKYAYGCVVVLVLMLLGSRAAQGTHCRTKPLLYKITWKGGTGEWGDATAPNFNKNKTKF